jgi:hypothetical protein
VLIWFINEEQIYQIFAYPYWFEMAKPANNENCHVTIRQAPPSQTKVKFKGQRRRPPE